MNPAIQAGTQALKDSGAIPSMLRAGQAAMSAEAPYDPAQDPALQGMVNGYNPDEDPELQQLLQPQDEYDPETDPELQEILKTGSIQQPQNDLMTRISMAESGGNPNARNPNSSASGEYQFTDDTWRGMVRNYGAQTGITESDKNKPDAQRIMAQLLTQENANAYKQAGFEPNDADLYMAHFLGAPSAVKAKKALGSGVRADQLFPKAAQANKPIFYNNGQPRTVDELYRVLGSKAGV